LYAGTAYGIDRIATNGTLSLFAGNDASIQWGSSGIGLGIDAGGNVYPVTLNQVGKTTVAGATTLLAGQTNGNTSAFSDGPRLLSFFTAAAYADAVVDSRTNIFVSDGYWVRKITPDGRVHTIAGTGVAGYRNGPGSIAQFKSVEQLCVDTNGNIYVVDNGNHCIRKISPDTSGIGIADDWQMAHFGHVGIDPAADPDHDGMSNYAEFWAGTDPLDGNSGIIQSIVITVGNHARISWQSSPGKSYTVQYSDDLITWISFGNPIIGDGSPVSIVDTTPVQVVPHRTYRVVVDF
ncbi:MAG TPA: hypothetical protein VN625_01030, partial [Desulfuromonadaceae bacterium]|nr:hypothetical protein [Desulfuromonadaceae bacterium]